MADRAGLLDRLAIALSRPGVDGVLGTPDILEDLLLLGAARRQGRHRLDEPRRPAGRRASSWTTGSPATTPTPSRPTRLDGGKMLIRIDLDDAGTVATLEASGAGRHRARRSAG